VAYWLDNCQKYSSYYKNHYSSDIHNMRLPHRLLFNMLVVPGGLGLVGTMLAARVRLDQGMAAEPSLQVGHVAEFKQGFTQESRTTAEEGGRQGRSRGLLESTRPFVSYVTILSQSHSRLLHKISSKALKVSEHIKQQQKLSPPAPPGWGQTEITCRENPLPDPM
jgi:hypothetical protein